MKYCPRCGERFRVFDWPKKCESCGGVQWKNPIPVAVAIVPVRNQDQQGFIVVRRAIEPKLGELAFPGGYVNLGEEWQKAASRELREETGVEIPASHFKLHEVRSSIDKTIIIIFGRTPIIERLPDFSPNSEVSEILVAQEGEKLGFPIHQEIFDEVFHVIH